MSCCFYICNQCGWESINKPYNDCPKCASSDISIEWDEQHDHDDREDDEIEEEYLLWVQNL